MGSLHSLKEALNIPAYIKDRGELIERELDRLVPEQEALHGQLFSAARYSLLGGGKRIRPILAIATNEVLGGNVDSILMPACALEMIHTYSLIHDDLPCMDDDDFRRGKPSLHKAYREGHAVLTGDFLLTYAFEVLANSKGLSAEQKLRLIDVLSRRSGSEGMIAGQVMDIDAEGKLVDLETLRQIHRNKTGALLLASIEFGAIVANASDKQMEILQKFGEEIGLAFQIVDDILDVTASQQKHGKKIASDVTNNKSTYVSLLGLKRSQDLAEEISKTALGRLQHLSEDASLLAGLAHLIVNRKA